MTAFPKAFADANKTARLEYLRSLTMERAARILEDLLSSRREFLPTGGSPAPLPPPLPKKSLALLLEGEIKDDF